MINENDCFDCANSTTRNILDHDSEWICKITNDKIPEEGIQEHDCPYFKYSE